MGVGGGEEQLNSEEGPKPTLGLLAPFFLEEFVTKVELIKLVFRTFLIRGIKHSFLWCVHVSLAPSESVLELVHSWCP